MTVTIAPTPRKRRNQRSSWEEQPTRIGSTLKGIVLTLLALSVLFPLWVILITSLSSREMLADAGGFVVIPRGIDFSAYETIFAGGAVTRALWISTMVTVIGTTVALTVTVLAAYGLSRPQTLGNRWLLAYFLLPFLIYPPLVPKYLVVTGLGLKNTIWALILPSAISVFNLVVIRGFFQSIPQELLDSAKIDGAGEFRILWRIVLPLSKAVVAVIGLFYAVGYWNVWFDALLFIDRNDLYPIQRVLQSYLLAGQAPNTSGGSVGNTMPPSEAIKMAVVILTVLPIVAVYPFIQRHFIKGVLIGAVKG
ncbi:carbohydrate ABC transporter permease [Paractinoplanes rishiriensis]|uniref:ABC transporter permease n=1 Tax=Paractinoplanes rishiriensis TaxID=1050105 RepID=A0A919KCF6_9ACTN|nr:carbohydrate ABC transporter permease [Actinoplanes rishiriensis]GIF01037.1 ABC transporter permease [Actinoplanes rishiriensis]